MIPPLSSLLNLARVVVATPRGSLLAKFSTTAHRTVLVQYWYSTGHSTGSIGVCDGSTGKLNFNLVLHHGFVGSRGTGVRPRYLYLLNLGPTYRLAGLSCEDPTGCPAIPTVPS